MLLGLVVSPVTCFTLTSLKSADVSSRGAFLPGISGTCVAMSPLIFDPVSNKPHQSNRSVEYNCFLTLPTEVSTHITFLARISVSEQICVFHFQVIQHIAALVPSDRDLCNLINTCSSLAAILIPPGSGIWRRRFRALYDPPPSNKTSEEIKVEYQIRSLVLRQSIPFHYGEGPKQELWLEVVKTLLIGMIENIKTSHVLISSHNSGWGRQEK